MSEAYFIGGTACSQRQVNRMARSLDAAMNIEHEPITLPQAMRLEAHEKLARLIDGQKICTYSASANLLCANSFIPEEWIGIAAPEKSHLIRLGGASLKLGYNEVTRAVVNHRVPKALGHAASSVIEVGSHFRSYAGVVIEVSGCSGHGAAQSLAEKGTDVLLAELRNDEYFVHRCPETPESLSNLRVGQFGTGGHGEFMLNPNPIARSIATEQKRHAESGLSLIS